MLKKLALTKTAAQLRAWESGTIKGFIKEAIAENNFSKTDRLAPIYNLVSRKFLPEHLALLASEIAHLTPTKRKGVALGDTGDLSPTSGDIVADIIKQVNLP